MIFLACTAVASVSAAVFVAIKSSSKSPVRVVWAPFTRTSKTQEIYQLASLLIKEIDRVEAQKLEQREDVTHVLTGIQSMIMSAWKLNSYYGEKSVSAFLRTIKIISDMPTRPPASDRYLYSLKTMVEGISKECASMIMRGENGDKVTDTTFRADDQFSERTSILENHINVMFDYNLRNTA